MSDWKKKAGLGSEVLPTITSVPGTAMVPVHDDGEAKQAALSDLVPLDWVKIPPADITVRSGGTSNVSSVVIGDVWYRQRVGNVVHFRGTLSFTVASGFKTLALQIPIGVVSTGSLMDGAGISVMSKSIPDGTIWAGFMGAPNNFWATPGNIDVGISFSGMNSVTGDYTANCTFSVYLPPGL